MGKLLHRPVCCQAIAFVTFSGYLAYLQDNFIACALENTLASALTTQETSNFVTQVSYIHICD